MKKLALFLLVLTTFLQINICQAIPDSALYLGQKTPGDSAVIFAPGIVSLAGRTENTITFSPDEKMCFFSVYGGATYFIEYKDGKWKKPFAENSKFGGEPSFSSDGKRVYLNSKKALNQYGSSDICYVARNDTSWNDPVSFGSPLNSSQGQWHPCMVADSSIYFSSNNGPICRSQYKNGVYLKPVFLPYPINGVSGDTWGDPYVSAREEYIIFRSGRQGGFGSIDNWISYRKKDGSWTNPKNLGKKINSSGEEFSGDITPDGKYMTFGRNNDIYWVSASFIDSLKHTNFIPYVKNQIKNQTDTIGHLFSYTIPDSTFTDDDGNNTLTYTAILSDGSLLPSWLNFEPVTRTFSGTLSAAGSFLIKVTATDNKEASTSCTFTLKVSTLTTVKQIIEQNIQLYPNPTDGNFTVKLGKIPCNDYHIEILDLDGRPVLKKNISNAVDATIDLTGNPKGIYLLNLFVDSELIFKKICLE